MDNRVTDNRIRKQVLEELLKEVHEEYQHDQVTWLDVAMWLEFKITQLGNLESI